MADEDLADRLKFYESLIPPLYPDGFPGDFRLNFDGWSLPEDIAMRDNADGIRPIGILDFEMISDFAATAIFINPP